MLKLQIPALKGREIHCFPWREAYLHEPSRMCHCQPFESDKFFDVLVHRPAGGIRETQSEVNRRVQNTVDQALLEEAARQKAAEGFPALLPRQDRL